MDVVVSSGADQGFSNSFEKTGRKSPRTTFFASIGGDEIFSSDLWRAALTEAVATAFFMFTLITSIISCFESHEADPKLLVPFLVFIIAFFFFLAIIPLSGGFLNPFVTFIAALMGVVTLVRACVYVLGQCIGSIMGFLLIKCVMSHDMVVKYMLGGCTINDNGNGISLGNALMLEFVCTFVVLLLGITVAFDKKRSKELGVTMVCVVIAASLAIAVYVSIVVTGQPGYAGAGVNPARCLGPALIQGGQLWYGHWVFWLGPFLACIVYYGFSKTFPREGLVSVGEHDIMKLARTCFEGTGTPNY